MPRKTCGHGRQPHKCWLCDHRIPVAAYWEAIRWCRKLPRKGVLPRVQRRRDEAA